MISTDTVKKGVRPDATKRNPILSNGIVPAQFRPNPDRYRGVKKVTPNPIPKDGFPGIQTNELRDIERRKRDAMLAAQRKAAGILTHGRSAKQPGGKSIIQRAGEAVLSGMIKADSIKPAAATAPAKPKGRPGRPRKSDTAAK
jgi:hypothetical protein